MCIVVCGGFLCFVFVSSCVSRIVSMMLWVVLVCGLWFVEVLRERRRSVCRFVGLVLCCVWDVVCLFVFVYVCEFVV